MRRAWRRKFVTYHIPGYRGAKKESAGLHGKEVKLSASFSSTTRAMSVLPDFAVIYPVNTSAYERNFCFKFKQKLFKTFPLDQKYPSGEMHLAANEKDKKYFKSPPWTQTFCVSPLCTEFKSLRVSAFLCELHAGRGGMQICDTTCHAMITRKHVAMETAITIVRRHISVAFLELSRQQIVTNLEPDHYTETR